MNFDFNNFMEAAPYLLLIYLFLKDKKLFVTPTEMADLRRKILEEVSQNFLSLLVFKQFEKIWMTNLIMWNNGLKMVQDGLTKWTLHLHTLLT